MNISIVMIHKDAYFKNLLLQNEAAVTAKAFTKDYLP